MGTENQSVLKMSTEDNVQYQEQLLNQIKPEISDRVQDQVQCPRSDEDCKLSILKSGVLIDGQFKNKIYSLLKNERLYNSIIAELEAGKIEIKEKDEVYRMKRGMLVVHQKERNTDFDFWRAIIPDEVTVKIFILTELHSIPYSLHPGIQCTLQKVKKHFFWKGMTGNVREYIESCPICQVEKIDHTLGRGNLQSTSIPERTWTEVSVDFVTDLPVTRSKKDSILTVVDKATRMVHLIPCGKSTTAAEAVKLYWDNVVKLHGVPSVLYSGRGTQFTSQFWKTLWGLTGTQLRYSMAYHPQT